MGGAAVEVQHRDLLSAQAPRPGTSQPLVFGQGGEHPLCAGGDVHHRRLVTQHDGQLGSVRGEGRKVHRVDGALVRNVEQDTAG